MSLLMHSDCSTACDDNMNIFINNSPNIHLSMTTQFKQSVLKILLCFLHYPLLVVRTAKLSRLIRDVDASFFQSSELFIVSLVLTTMLMFPSTEHPLIREGSSLENAQIHQSTAGSGRVSSTLLQPIRQPVQTSLSTLWSPVTNCGQCVDTRFSLSLSLSTQNNKGKSASLYEPFW